MGCTLFYMTVYTSPLINKMAYVNTDVKVFFPNNVQFMKP